MSANDTGSDRKLDTRSWLELWRIHSKAKPKRKSDTQPWLACTQEEAKPYKKYKTLYGERKFARDFVSPRSPYYTLNSAFWKNLGTDVCHIQSTQKQNLSFSDDLPVEIRLQVYEYLFKTPDKFFELWAPEEWTRRQGQTEEGRSTKYGHWAKNSFRQFASQKRGLRLMRLCKKIHDEVADYFYGGNNFRFTHFDGFLVMAAFNHTIRPATFSFLKHITVQIPNRMRDSSYREGMDSKTGWRNFDRLLTRRGMRVPDYGVRIGHGKRSYLVQGEGDYTYDQAVRKGFRQLRDMPNLKLLEITIPWDYHFLRSYRPSHPRDKATQCHCPVEDVEAMGPEDRIWHTIEEHCRDPDYFTLLADLKENTASGDLTIALVFHYGSLRWTDESNVEWRDNLRQGRWIAAYAAMMGYEFGHAIWEEEGPQRGTYQVRYDEDPRLALVPVDQEENSLLEPPELPELPELPEYQ